MTKYTVCKSRFLSSYSPLSQVNNKNRPIIVSPRIGNPRFRLSIEDAAELRDDLLKVGEQAKRWKK